MNKYITRINNSIIFQVLAACLLLALLIVPFLQNQTFALEPDCTDSGGVWVQQQEAVGGVVVDGSFCDCPTGKNLIDGACVDAGGNTEIKTSCDEDVLNRGNCGIINLLVIAINVLSAIAGLAIVASLMIAGFQYMTAQDNAGQIQKAKSRIIMTLLALALFIFMYALLNFLVPGGVL